MQKNQKRKNGFTLVELSIVIAVIAILIAVLVPTFTALIDKANKTNDNSLVKNLNTGLSTDEAINGKPSTIDEALVAAEGAGYKVENLTPTSDGTLIVWNEVDNEFVYVEADLVNGNLVEVDGEALTTDSCNIWIITKSYDSTYADFSQYISGTITSIDETVKAGISVGNNTNIDISYANSNGEDKEVTFVTNGGTLTLNDANATVHHYGSADTVTVTAVNTASYHIYGTVTGNIEVVKGHVVVESGSDASTVYVTGSDVTIDNNSSNKVYVSASTEEIAEKLDEIVQSGTVDTTSTPVIDSTLAGYFAGGFGTEENPFLISTDLQFNNIHNVSWGAYESTYDYDADNPVYYKLTNDIVLDYRWSWDNGVIAYGGYLFYSVLDGDGCTLDTTYGDAYYLFHEINNSELKNLTVTLGNNTCSLALYANGTTTFTEVYINGNVTFGSRNLGLYSIYTNGEITFDSCINYATITGIGGEDSYCAVFVGYNAISSEGNDWTLNLTFNNCENAGSLTAGKAAMFIGNLCGVNSNVTLTINNCKNTGSLRSTYTKYTPDYYIASGSISSSDNFIVNGTNYTSGKAPTLSNVYQGPNDSVQITVNSDNCFVISESDIGDANYYIISLGISTIVDKDNGGGTDIWYVRIKVSAKDFTDGTYVTTLQNLQFMDLATYKTYDDDLSEVITYSADGYTYYTVSVDGTTYYLIYAEEQSLSSETGISSGRFYSVSVYDENGSLLSSASL